MVKKSVWFLLFVLSASACLDEPDCFSLNNDNIGISFKKLVDSTRDTVMISAIRTDDPFVTFFGDTVSSIVLPLNYFKNETTFFFDDAQGTKVLRLQYTSQVQFVSENCGERFVLSDLKVLEHSFDSVRVLLTDPAPNNQSIHFEIFQ
jgi:hypothetical protein